MRVLAQWTVSGSHGVRGPSAVSHVTQVNNSVIAPVDNLCTMAMTVSVTSATRGNATNSRVQVIRYYDAP